MDVRRMTLVELRAVPERRNWAEPARCAALVVLPAPDGEELHDSGYRRIDAVAVDRECRPICRVAGNSDVINLEGIGGAHYGHGSYSQDGVWSFDCLPASGCIRLMADDRDIVVGESLSNLCVYSDVRGEISRPEVVVDADSSAGPLPPRSRQIDCEEEDT